MNRFPLELLAAALLAAGPAHAQDAAPAPKPRPTVTLVRPGEEPRHELRYAPPVGTRQETRVTIKMGSQVEVDGTEMPAQEMPAVESRLEVSVSAPPEAAEPGAFGVTTQIAGVQLHSDLNDPNTDRMARLLQTMTGMKMRATMTPSGHVEAGPAEYPKEADPQAIAMLRGVEQNLAQATVQFPEEPIGIGAAWNIEMDIEVSGIRGRQRVECELLELDGDVASLGLRIIQTAEPQRIRNDAMRPGTSMELISLDNQATGRSRINIKRPSPISYTLDTTSRAETRVSQDGLVQPIKQRMTMNVAIESEDAE